MSGQQIHGVLESGHGCFALFGAVPASATASSAPEAVGGTLLEWLDWAPGTPPLLIVKGGSQCGPYATTLRLRENAPVRLEDTWEDVAEVSVDFIDGTLALGALDDGPRDPMPMSGIHRLRVSARGRTEGAARERRFPDEADEDEPAPLEHFLLELWPAPGAAPVVVRERSRFAHDVVHPPEPDWPAERDPGLVAARAVAEDLRSTASGTHLSGRLTDVLVTREVDGTATRVFNRVTNAYGWPPGNGGMRCPEQRVGGRSIYYGDPPDSDGLSPLLGVVETTIVEIDKPRQFVVAWNWRVAGPDGLPHPGNPRLLDQDALVQMGFTMSEVHGTRARTLVSILHTGVPEEWHDHLARLWEWDIATYMTL